MKPKDLKTPFTWEERRILFQDRILYVPPCLDNPDSFSLPSWDSPEIFGNSNPISIEYCSGNGAWIADRAEKEHQFNWIAVEKKFKRVRKIWSKLKNRNLSNLIIICAEAYHVTATYFPSHTIQNVYINFPDPWPKNRHVKHRLITVPFANELSRILKPTGELTLVTDDPGYSNCMTETFGNHSDFIQTSPKKETLSNYGTSYFDQLWRGLGKTIDTHCFQKKK